MKETDLVNQKCYYGKKRNHENSQLKVSFKRVFEKNTKEIHIK